jgi:MaoC like domain
MKLARFGIPGSEKPALIDGQGRLRDLSEYFADITAESLSDQQLKKIAAIDSESGISPDSNQGSSCLSRRNMILGGAAVVAAISVPKNGSASTPLSTTGQLSKNNDGKDDSMNSTTEIPETARAFDPRTFTVVPARTFEDLRVGEIFRAPSRTLTDAHASAFQAVSADNHPIHYDEEYARRHGHTAPVVHDLQVLIAVPLNTRLSGPED